MLYNKIYKLQSEYWTNFFFFNNSNNGKANDLQRYAYMQIASSY